MTTIYLPDTSMTSRIQEYLRELENIYGIKILYAVESGSRAWGYPSSTSDYDVRFIYVRPPAEYLNLKPHKDTISFGWKGETLVDLHGWDIRKACNLAYKTNASLVEWLHSPTVYINVQNFREEFLCMVSNHARLRSLYHHYLNQAKSIYLGEIKNYPSVASKRYLYVIRCLLNCTFLTQYDELPPVAIQDYFEETDSSFLYLLSHAEGLIEDRAKSAELDVVKAILPLHSLIDYKLGEFAEKTNFIPGEAAVTTIDDLDRFCKIKILLQNKLTHGPTS